MRTVSASGAHALELVQRLAQCLPVRHEMGDDAGQAVGQGIDAGQEKT
ncbi:hypothetical protein [Komagataeibacter xylinus]|nr:hypothetical protein [Komagataeibacter xylinus]